MNKKTIFLTLIILFTIALVLLIPNYAWAAPTEEGHIKLTDLNVEGEPEEVYIYDATGNNPVDTTIKGIKYNPETNTLVLDGFKGKDMWIQDMGDDFKVEVLNTNEITGIICMAEGEEKDVLYSAELEILGKGKLYMKGIAGIHCKDLTVKDVTIEIVEDELEEGMGVDAFLIDENLNINSATISILNATTGFMVMGDVNITEGNIAITALDIGIISNNMKINSGSLVIKAENIGIAGKSLNFNGGKVIIDSGMCAAFAENNFEGTHITLAENMEVEEETSLRNYKDNHGYYLTTFGTDEIIINVESGEILNCSKKVTIKEIVKDDEIIDTPEDEENDNTDKEQEPGQDLEADKETNTDKENNPNDNNQNQDTGNKEDNQNTNNNKNNNTNNNTNNTENDSKKDETPKTGNSIIEIGILLSCIVVSMAVYLIKKS